jgi:hypothetical protein
MTRRKKPARTSREELRILFLDIDGVLNSEQWVRQCIGTAINPFRQFDPAAVKHLRGIVDATGCSIVISSSWRQFHALDEIGDLLLDAGYGSHRPPIIDATPVLPGALYLGAVDTLRGREIELWRQTAGHRGHYCILDDNRWFLSDQPLVLTDIETGLTGEHAQRAIALLRPTVANAA